VPSEGLVITTLLDDGAVKHGRVLLADSHLGMLGGVHSLLDALFETVLMVADERSLLEAATTFKPDLVVVDLSLPREGEANVARRLIGQHPELRLIVLSVHDEPTVVGQMLDAGVAGFVLKRSAATDLIPAVKEVLRGGTHVCPALRELLPESGNQSPTRAHGTPPVE
jgi:DNA-binding NarL/FixJ family response regulator